MKKIITAFANPELNKKLAKEKEYEIIAPDIQYQEAVLEILEENKDINILILNSILEGEYDLYKFINKIKEININLNIIIILEKENEEIKNFLHSKGITDIFYNNKITIDELIKLLKKEKNIIPEEINEEIKILKEMILNNKINNNIKNKKKYKLINNIFNLNKKIIKELKLNQIKKLIIKNKINNKNKLIKIITVVGSSNTGKSIFSSILLKTIKNNKVLLIDFDFINNNISTIFRPQKNS